jgi:hypothetical protein
MKSKTTKTFEYSVEDIERLIKKDIDQQLEQPHPKFDKVQFNVTMENDPTDWRAEYPLSPVFKGATVNVEV